RLESPNRLDSQAFAFSGRREPSDPVPPRALRTGSQPAPHAEPFILPRELGGRRQLTEPPRSAPRGFVFLHGSTFFRLGDRRLQEAPITQARAAAEASELALVQREHHFDREELDLNESVAHLASFRYVSSWASIKRSAAASARSISGSFLTGRMMRASPSVRTSSGVSFVMSSSSRIGRSMMRPRLLPTAESFLTIMMEPRSYARNTPSITSGIDGRQRDHGPGPRGEPQAVRI